MSRYLSEFILMVEAADVDIDVADDIEVAVIFDVLTTTTEQKITQQLFVETQFTCGEQMPSMVQGRYGRKFVT